MTELPKQEWVSQYLTVLDLPVLLLMGWCRITNLDRLMALHADYHLAVRRCQCFCAALLSTLMCLLPACIMQCRCVCEAPEQLLTSWMFQDQLFTVLRVGSTASALEAIHRDTGGSESQ